MKKIYLLLILTSALLVAGCSQSDEDNIPPGEIPKPTFDAVIITSSGFSPSELTIVAGRTVTWINKDTVEHWPASAIHPTHALYPETGGCIGSKFDACQGLKQDEQWSFTFNQKGTWKYHDHLNLASTGTIVVE